MKDEAIKNEILRLVAAHDGEMSWYQLDRALAHDDNLAQMHRLGALLDELIADGFMLPEGEDPRPRYRITETGRSRVERVPA